MIKNIFLLLRPHQWVKNMFIFLPLFFDRHLFDSEILMPAIVAFFAFCFSASGIYCFNDIYDVEADKLHPVKCKRPIASGKISKALGYLIMTICFCISIGTLTFFFNINHFCCLIGIILFYIVMNIAYCIVLKHKPIVDVFIIALGFVLRVLVGGIASEIALSEWIVLMTFLLALFLAFAKRRDDVVIYENTGVAPRENVNRYNLAFMNQAISIVASITMVCYIMYTVSPEVTSRFNSRYIYITSIFVLAGIIRYLQVTIVDDKSGSPTKVLFKDRFIQSCIIGWILVFVVLLYF